MQNKLLLPVNYHAPLSNCIAQSYNRLVLLLSTIDCSDKTIKKHVWTGGIVSVSDIIAYHIGWATLLIAWYEAGMRNETITMPGEGFTTWNYDGLANHFYALYAYDDCFQQEHLFYSIVTKIIEITEHEYTTNNLDKLGVWPWCTLMSGKQWPLSKWIQVNTVAPYNRSVKIIRKPVQHSSNLP